MVLLAPINRHKSQPPPVHFVA
jgi:hypothetical protein